MTHDKGGAAFPGHSFTKDGNPNGHTMGMTLRAYAAIKLRVPDSGIDWIDAMIERARRDDFAGQAIRARWGNGQAMTAEEAASMAFQLADAMLAAREGANTDGGTHDTEE